MWIAGALVAASPGLASCCLACLAEGLIQVGAGQPVSVVNSEATTGHIEVELVLGLLEQLLPHVYGDDDTLGTPVGSEVHRLALPGVEAPGDLVERVTRLARSHDISHAATVRESVRIARSRRDCLPGRNLGLRRS